MPRIGFLVILLAAPLFADSITIGTLTYLGTNSAGYSSYSVNFDTTGVTAHPFELNLALGGSFGPFSSVQELTLGPGPGIINCPCTAVEISIYFPSSQPPTLQLVSGSLFHPLPITNSFILPLAGQMFIQPGQSVLIEITAVPEPGTMLLVASGLPFLLKCLQRPRRQIISGPSS